ncbi:MAG: recombination mediator RecR [Gammaproteobacteria bacterium]|nr:recombination mediator RecR [Gammaproteobacteria bacterium]
MDTLSQLVDALRCLPGVGPKSAQRMAFHLLQQHQRNRGLHLAQCLTEAMTAITHCQICNNYTTETICDLCQKPDRDPKTLCVVESPTDVIAIEQCLGYQGRYFVLMGKISPIDGIGPDDIGLQQLQTHVRDTNIQEVILALSPSIESQTTVHFIQEKLQHLPVKISQLAHGIPSGGELSFLDGHTISSALRNRENCN